MERHRVGRGRVLLRSSERRDHAVGFRRAGQVDRRLREVELGLGQPDVLDRLRGRHRDHQRARIRQPDVLARVHDHPPGDEPGVLARLEHPGQPEERRVGIGPADALDERRDHVVVRVALAVVDDRLLLHGVGRAARGVTVSSPADRAARTAASSPVSAIRASPPATSTRCSSASSSARPPCLARPRSSSARACSSSARSSSGDERLELQQDAPREQRRVQREVRVLRRRADQRHGPLFDGRQEHVLLRLRPAVHLVDEQHRPEQAAACACSITLRASATPEETAESCTSWAPTASASRYARVVLPVPAGPHRTIEGSVPPLEQLRERLARTDRGASARRTPRTSADASGRRGGRRPRRAQSL